MLHRVLTVALNTYREAVRARILLGLAGVALAAAFYSLVVGAFTVRDAARAVADLGAATISIFSIMVAILIGATTENPYFSVNRPLLSRSRVFQKSSASAEATRQMIVWTMSTPGSPGDAPGYSKKVSAAPGLASSSAK